MPVYDIVWEEAVSKYEAASFYFGIRLGLFLNRRFSTLSITYCDILFLFPNALS